jgi:hypothetical protein
MKVSDSVRFAIDAYTRRELESAMLHACNAIDGTAAKICPGVGSRRRFTNLLRERLLILGAWGLGGIDLVQTRFPVGVKSPAASDGRPDIADVIYSVHRCTHGHGDELPDGFALTESSEPNGDGMVVSEIEIVNGSIRLPDLIVMGLCMVAVTSPANADQQIPPTYWIKWRGKPLVVSEWWGRGEALIAEVAQLSMPQVKLDFREWMDGK